MSEPLEGERAEAAHDEDSTVSDGSPTPVDSTAAVADELIRWRARLISEGAEGAESLKDVTLRRLAKLHRTDVDAIRRLIPGAPHLAEGIAAITARYRTNVTAPESPKEDSMLPLSTRERAHQNDALLDLDHGAFCEYEFEESDVRPARITFKSVPNGWRLSFDPYPADRKMVIYRVVAGEGLPPYKPEAGDLVAVTSGLVVDDLRFPAAAVRAYQIWCHVGVDLDDACRAQPFLLAEGERVSPVDGFAVADDEGRVIGEWSVFPGTLAVHVFRTPLGDIAPSVTRNDQRHRICAEEANLTGFVDMTAIRGQRYLYQALAEVPVGDTTRLSAPRQVEILVSAVLEPVEGLHIAAAGDGDAFDFTWATPPVGQVYVYRFDSPPPAGLERTELSEAALAVQGFTQDARVKNPVVAKDGNSRMQGVAWPAGWLRVYFVPLTVLNGKAQVGATQTMTRKLPPVMEARIVERYHTQVLTFMWPAGATSVKVFIGRELNDPEEICANNKPLAQVSHAEYERDGGLIFKTPLMSNGCTVYVRGVTYSRAAEIAGEITTLRYPGLTRLRYRLELDSTGNRAALMLDSETDIEAPPALVLINNPARFPLSPDDGRPIYLTPPEGGQAMPHCVLGRSVPKGSSDSRWRADLTDVYGFIRVFLSHHGVADRPFGLVDPDPEQYLWRGESPEARQR